MNDTDTIFSARLRQLRLSRGLSAQELAEAAGLTKQALHLIEAGGRGRKGRGKSRHPGVHRVFLGTAVALANALGVPLDELRRPVNPEPPPAP